MSSWAQAIPLFDSGFLQKMKVTIEITNGLDGILSSCNCIQLWVCLFQRLLSTPLVVPKPCSSYSALFDYWVFTENKSYNLNHELT